MLFYRASLPLSRQTLNFAAGIIRRHRISIGSLWRKLNPGQQALLVLVYLRKGETFASLAAGFGVGTATAWRYVEETVALLAARAPRLRKAVRDAARAGHAYVVLDGTLIPIDRVAADRPFYSGKHKKHGMNLQVIAGPRGDILWVSGALPGSVHDKKAEWMWGVLAELEAAGLVTLADKGYQGSTYAKIPYKGKNKPDSQKQANKAHRDLGGDIHPQPAGVIHQRHRPDLLFGVGQVPVQPHPQRRAAAGDRQPRPSAGEGEGAVIPADRHQRPPPPREPRRPIAVLAALGGGEPGIGVAAQHRPGAGAV